MNHCSYVWDYYGNLEEIILTLTEGNFLVCSGINHKKELRMRKINQVCWLIFETIEFRKLRQENPRCKTVLDCSGRC